MSGGLAFLVFVGIVFALVAAVALAGRWQRRRARRRLGRA